VVFAKPAGDKDMKLTVHQPEGPVSGYRFGRPSLTPQQLAEYAGTFHCDELRVLYGVALREGQLRMRHPRGEALLRPLARDTFSGEVGGPVTVRFLRSGAGQVEGLTVSTQRARNLRFARVEFQGNR
jgi:hypothetical protein